VQLRYNYRLYPTPGQQHALAKAFGCARVVFNDGLRARQQAHQAGLPYLTDAELSARLTAAKATAERAWLAEVSAVVWQQALADLNAAYRNFFASVTGKAKAARPARRGGGHARTAGNPSGSPRTPGGASRPAASRACPRRRPARSGGQAVTMRNDDACTAPWAVAAP
jgi:Helix-turn-helix domain